MAVAGVRVCSVVEEDLDGSQETCLGRVVQRRRIENPDTGVAGTAVVRAGTVVQEGANVLRIVLAALVIFHPRLYLLFFLNEPWLYPPGML
jgi:hypothetical protein